MNFLKTVLLVLFGTFLHSTQLHAQNSLFDIKDLSNVRIDDYSDEYLMSFYNKGVESGLSENHFLKIASDRGLPASEIEKLRSRLERIMPLKNVPDRQESTDTTSEKNDYHRYDSSDRNKYLEKFKNDESIFGSELFTANSLVFEPNLRIPAPAGYILGPDDEIVVSVFGYSEKKYNLKVDEQGEIYIPNVGPILISGLSLEQAGEKIKSKLASTIYRAINSGRTQVQISLNKIRSIRVTVIGQAKKPGSFTISSLTTLYNILYLCGGPTPMGSYRNIQIIRGNGIKKTADLYDFLVDGDQKNNILLQEGDVIRIPYYENRVTISGNVKRQGKFEMVSNETFDDLLKYSGGFTDNAFRGAVSVIRVTDTNKKIIDLVTSRYAGFKINGSDEFIVGKLQEDFNNRIFVTGSVQRPGPYELTEMLTLKSLIEKAGGLTVDAYTKRATIFRYYENKMPSVLSISLDSVSENNQIVYLKKDDSVSIHSIFEFKDKNFITVEGNVRNPGQIQWRDNISLRDVLLAAGGISESGDSSTIEISRRIKEANVSKLNHNESNVFNINLNSDAASAGDMRLQPYDLVIIKSKPGYGVQRSVLVVGEVKSAGKYSLINSGEKISDIIKRTGGFKASADSNSITIRRNIKSSLTIAEREKLFQRILDISPDSLSQHPRLKDELYKSYDMISVDLEAALANPGNPENLSLEDGDILSVDRNSNLVKISGEVYYPTIVSFIAKKNLKYYVQQAGNFMPYARKTGSLVIHPDGKVESVKHFLWFKFYPSVTPRSEIFVPQKMKNNRQRIGAGEWALIISALGIVGNVIINATK